MKYKINWTGRKDWYTNMNKEGTFKVTLEAGEYFFELDAEPEIKDINSAIYKLAEERYAAYKESEKLQDMQDYVTLMAAIRILMSNETGKVFLKMVPTPESGNWGTEER